MLFAKSRTKHLKPNVTSNISHKMLSADTGFSIWHRTSTLSLDCCGIWWSERSLENFFLWKFVVPKDGS